MRHSFLKSQKILENRAFYSNELYDFNIAGKFENFLWRILRSNFGWVLCPHLQIHIVE